MIQNACVIIFLLSFDTVIFFIAQIAWKPDGTQLLTASGDKSCKLWDAETKTLISEFAMGSQIEDQQVAKLE